MLRIWKWVFWLRHPLLCSAKCSGNQGRRSSVLMLHSFMPCSLGSWDCCKLPPDTRWHRTSMGIFKSRFRVEEEFIRASVEFVIFPLTDFQYLSISGASSSFKWFLLNMVRRADGPGNGVLVPGKGRGEGEGVFQGPHFLTIWSLKLRPCLNACCGLEQWLGKGIYCLASCVQLF